MRSYLMLSHISLHMLPRPSIVLYQLRPVVVILRRSSHIHHIIDAAGSTEELPPRDMVRQATVAFL